MRWARRARRWPTPTGTICSGCATGGSTVNPLSKQLAGRGGGGRVPAGDGGATVRAGLRHRRRGLQDRRSGVAAAAGLRRPRAALGDRLEVPGRAGDDGAARHRHPGRPHRRADAGRAAGAGERRRRAGAERHAAQRGRDRAQGHPHRRHGGDPARRRRDPADCFGGEGATAEGRQAVSSSRRPVRSAAATRCGRPARRCAAAPAG